MVDFKSDANLGKVIKAATLKCTIGVEPSIQSIEQLAIAAGARKLSQLCGFSFETSLKKAQGQPTRFQIMYMPRQHGTRFKRNSADANGWYFLVRQGFGNINAITKDQLFLLFQFDANKFFDSDYFKAKVATMQKVLTKGVGLAMQMAETLRKNHDAEDARLVSEYAAQIRSHIQNITNPHYSDIQIKLCTAQELVAAYNAGKAKTAVSAAVDQKIDALRQANVRTLAGAAKTSSKREKGDFMLQRVKHAKANGGTSQLDEDESYENCATLAELKRNKTDKLSLALCKTAKEQFGNDGDEVVVEWSINGSKVNYQFWATEKDRQDAIQFGKEHGCLHEADSITPMHVLNDMSQDKVSSASLLANDAAVRIELVGADEENEYDEEKELDKDIEKAIGKIYK